MSENFFNSPFFNPKRIEIPKIFHSIDKGGLFDECVVCQKNLLEPHCDYFIEKAIKTYDGKSYDVIFEYAICAECALSFSETLSHESMQKINEFLHSSTNLKERWHEFTDKHNYNLDDWIDECIITGKKRSELQEYQINTMCRGDQMLFTIMPYMISEDAIDMAQSMLSVKTKDELDNFRDKYLGPGPEISELLKDRTPVIIF